MFFKSRIEQLEEIFLRQFENDGDRLFYRKQGRGAPIPLTHQEQEEFRLQYRKACGRMILGAVLIIMTAISLGVVIAPGFIADGPGIFIITFGTIGLIAVLSVRSSTAPARALEHRSPVGNELSKEEWHSRHFATTSWPLLCSSFLISTAICVGLVVHSEFQEWSDYLWASGSGAFSILGARALWLKYRLSRQFN